MRNIVSNKSLNTDLASLLLRLTFGGLFVRFGYMKLTSFQDLLPIFPDPIGVGSTLSLMLVIFSELLCGFLVTIGLVTRLAIIPIFITMTVVVFVIHRLAPFDEKVLPLLLWLLCPVVFILGGGKFSADRNLFKSYNRR